MVPFLSPVEVKMLKFFALRAVALEVLEILMVVAALEV
jgi:hypothetical protein